MTDPVLSDVTSDGIARIRLNRPEASNGMNAELLKGLNDAILAAHADRHVRVVVLTGEGRNFCAGGDVKTFAAKGEALPDYLREATAWLQIATASLLRLRAPVVTGVHGYAAGGGGFGLVCASDFVVATRSARFFSGAVRVGMAPDAGSTVTLAQIVGVRKALEILVLNPTLSAADAARLGLVNRLVEDDELETGLSAMAAPVWGARGEVIAALSISGPTLRMTPSRIEELRPLLTSEARTLSRRLGHRDEGERAA